MKRLLLLIFILLAINIEVYSQIEIPKKLKAGVVDKFNDIVIYTHRNVAYNSWVPIAAQIKVNNKSNEVELLIKLYYYGASWIFFNKVLVKYNDASGSENTFEIPFNIDRKDEVVVNTGGVVETVKMTPSNDLLLSLKSFAENENGFIRFEGEGYFNKKAERLYLKPFLETIIMYEEMTK